MQPMKQSLTDNSNQEITNTLIQHMSLVTFIMNNLIQK